MNVLVIGQGGREHAICQAINQDPLVQKFFAYPGNPGIFELIKANPVHLTKNASVIELAQWAKTHHIDLTIVGPEDYLSQGIVDCFEDMDLSIFGPSQNASQLESSKIFAKKIMQQVNIPTGSFNIIENLPQATQTFNAQQHYPIVLKYDGLAAGKGVAICQTKQEALDFCHQVFDDKIFSDQPKPILVEEFLQGQEVSYFALCNNQKFCFFGDAQDHKRLLADDTGPNTGGMGAFTPTHIMNAQLRKTIEDDILKPLLKTMHQQGMPYVGFLYLGIILTSKGPKVLEFNVRLGDPEAQCLLSRLTSPLAQTLKNILNNNASIEVQWKSEKSFAITLASKNYPYGSSESTLISIKQALPKNILLYHCGTQIINQQLYTHGGRILSLVALAKTYAQAADLAYNTIKNHIDFDGMQYRHDIGKNAISYEIEDSNHH